MVWITAACRLGSCRTEFSGSAKYHRQEKPCQTAWECPLLNENSTASPIGTSDQSRYSQVNPSRNHGCRQGLPRGHRRADLARAPAAAGRAASVVTSAALL